MRVGLFSDYYLAMNDGTAIATEISRQGLTDLGHKVFVFCPAIPHPKPKGANVVTLPSLPGLIYPGIRLVWPFSKRTLARIARLKLDVIHIETPLLTGLLGLWAGRRLGIPVVMSAHLDMEFMSEYKVAPLALFGFGLAVAVICRQPSRYLHVMFSPRQRHDLGRRANFAWRTLAFLSDQCDKTIAISQKERDILSGFIKNDNLVVVPNGLNFGPAGKLTKRAARQKLGIEKNTFVILTASRLVREKRIELAVGAMPVLLKKHPGSQLLIMNDGPKRQPLARLSRELGIAEHVVFMGLVQRDELREYLAAADVFVNPSLREVASLAILEAAFSAKPLLLFDERLVEPLADGVNGFFVSNSGQLAEKLAWLAAKPNKLASLGRASRQRVRSRYSVRAHSTGLAKVYAELIRADSRNNRRTRSS